MKVSYALKKHWKIYVVVEVYILSLTPTFWTLNYFL